MRLITTTCLLLAFGCAEGVKTHPKVGPEGASLAGSGGDILPPQEPAPPATQPSAEPTPGPDTSPQPIPNVDFPAEESDNDEAPDPTPPRDETERPDVAPHPSINGPCGLLDEEESEPNDAPAQASPLAVGVFEGAICNGTDDYFRITVEGPWRVQLGFDPDAADLDMYVWDSAADDRKTDRHGRPIGSDSYDAEEALTFRGPATIKILGYEGARTSYRLTLLAL